MFLHFSKWDKCANYSMSHKCELNILHIDHTCCVHNTRLKSNIHYEGNCQIE